MWSSSYPYPSQAAIHCADAGTVPQSFFAFVDEQQRKSKQTNTHEETTQLTKKTAQKKHKWKRAERDHVQKKKGKKSSEADSFRNLKVKISYTPEDGHVGRNM
jgi:hypothetical protein